VAESAQQARKPSRFYDRDSVAFARVLAFTDGVFAIAATLLVVGIEVPDLGNPDSVDELWDALGDLLPSIIGYVISFAVIGRYWYAHHQFFSDLRGIDGRLIATNLLYLGFIAFMPFPTGILGQYFENPLSIALYAAIVAVVSGLEVVMFSRAYRDRLLLSEITEDQYRWSRLTSFLPTVFFLASVPVAFASTTAAVLIWAATPAFGGFIQRWAPPEADPTPLD
jgi:uncharacterized membrane protein